MLNNSKGAILTLVLVLIALVTILAAPLFVLKGKILKNQSVSVEFKSNASSDKEDVEIAIVKPTFTINPSKILFERGGDHVLFEYDLKSKVLKPFYPLLMYDRGVWPTYISPYQDKIGFYKPVPKENESLDRGKSREFIVINLSDRTYKVIDLGEISKQINTSLSVIPVGWSLYGDRLVFTLYDESLSDKEREESMGSTETSYITYNILDNKAEKTFSTKGLAPSYMAYDSETELFVYSDWINDHLRVINVNLRSGGETVVSNFGVSGGDDSSLPTYIDGYSLPVNGKYVFFKNVYIEAYKNYPDIRSDYKVYSLDTPGKEVVNVKEPKFGKFADPTISYSGDYFYVEFNEDYRVYKIDGTVIYSGKLQKYENGNTIFVSNLFLRDNKTWIFSLDSVLWKSLNLETGVVSDLFDKEIKMKPRLSY